MPWYWSIRKIQEIRKKDGKLGPSKWYVFAKPLKARSWSQAHVADRKQMSRVFLLSNALFNRLLYDCDTIGMTYMTVKINLGQQEFVKKKKLIINFYYHVFSLIWHRTRVLENYKWVGFYWKGKSHPDQTETRFQTCAPLNYMKEPSQ